LGALPIGIVVPLELNFARQQADPHHAGFDFVIFTLGVILGAHNGGRD
jgi:hypothetical protein